MCYHNNRATQAHGTSSCTYSCNTSSITQMLVDETLLIIKETHKVKVLNYIISHALDLLVVEVHNYVYTLFAIDL